MNENYLREFQRWTAGPPQRRAALSAELAEHLAAAKAAGELGSTLERLGPPRDAAKAFAAGHEFHLAPYGKRIAALFIDIWIPTMLAFAVIAIAVAAGVGGIDELFEFARDLMAEREADWTPMQMVMVLSLCVAWLWWIAGLAIMEWRYGRTPGKALMGLRVVSEEGIALTFGQAVVRNLTRVFTGTLQIIDWAWALFGSRRQRAVEKLCHTLVIRDDPPEPRRSAAAGAPVSDGA